MSLNRIDKKIAFGIFSPYKSTRINFSSEEIVGNGKVILYEKVNNIKTGFFVFKNIDLKKNILKGQWFSIDGSKSYKVILNKINL